MTLIVSVLTRKKSFMICDKMHSVDGTDDNPVKASFKLDNVAVNITTPKLRINTGTKIYQYDKNLIGGAGDYSKLLNYFNEINCSKTKDYSNFTQQYYKTNREKSPDQLMILSKKQDLYKLNIFSIYQIDEFFSFTNYFFVNNKNKIGAIAIGSGSQIFLQMYNFLKSKLIKEYESDLNEMIFVSKIQAIYEDVSKYDDHVSSETNVYEI